MSIRVKRITSLRDAVTRKIARLTQHQITASLLTLTASHGMSVKHNYLPLSSDCKLVKNEFRLRSNRHYTERLRTDCADFKLRCLGILPFLWHQFKESEEKVFNVECN